MRIIGAKRLKRSREIIYRIEWTVRIDGTKLKNSVFRSKFVRKLCPNLLIDFYEQRSIQILNRE